MAMILATARSGVTRVWAHRRLLVPFYLANAVFGLLAMLPVGLLLDEYVGNSLMRERLGVAMDFDFFFEFMLGNGDGLAAAQGVAVAVMAIYWIVTLFLSGGALTVFFRDDYTPPVFWGGAAMWFGRFFRLALWSLPVLIAFFLIRLTETAAVRLIWGPDPYEYIVYWGAWVKLVLGYLGLISYFIVFDYARIHMVLTDERSARRSLVFGLRFAARNWGQTLGLALLLFCAGWLAVAVYALFSGWMTMPHWLILILLILGQQAYILFRMGLRLTSYSSQMQLYRRLTPLTD
jgi:hypothetical protein